MSHTTHRGNVPAQLPARFNEPWRAGFEARRLFVDEYKHVHDWARRRMDLRPGITGLYLAYEDWAAAGHPNLATHYLVRARVEARKQGGVADDKSRGVRGAEAFRAPAGVRG